MRLKSLVRIHNIQSNSSVMQLADNKLRPTEHHQIDDDIMKFMRELGAEINYNKDHWTQFCCFDLSLKEKFKGDKNGM